MILIGKIVPIRVGSIGALKTCVESGWYRPLQSVLDAQWDEIGSWYFGCVLLVDLICIWPWGCRT